jgi:adenosine/AMP kinase
VVVTVGNTDFPIPLVTDMAPGVTTPVPPVKVGIRVTESPLVIVDAEAVKAAVGAATTVNVAAGEDVTVPQPLLTTTV